MSAFTTYSGLARYIYQLPPQGAPMHALGSTHHITGYHHQQPPPNGVPIFNEVLVAQVQAELAQALAAQQATDANLAPAPAPIASMAVRVIRWLDTPNSPLVNAVYFSFMIAAAFAVFLYYSYLLMQGNPMARKLFPSSRDN